MNELIYDVIVVGAGVEGSATAYQLSKRGVKVLLLEQFPLSHARGSSHGASRITRKAYTKHYYTEMMDYCMPEWERIQEETGQILFKKTGFLQVGPLSSEVVMDVKNSLKLHNAPFEALSHEVLRERFPNLAYPDDYGAVLDENGGILYADKCLQSLQKLFVRNGGVVKDREKVRTIRPGTIVDVVTFNLTYRCRSIVLCCGPWTNKVLNALHLQLELPLRPLKISVCYWAEKLEGSHSSRSYPPYSDKSDRSVTFPHSVYFVPSHEYPGYVKMCLHHGPDADPDHRDAVNSQWVVELLKKYVHKHLPGLEQEPSIVELCFYTMTPDEDFILDCHPAWKNIVIGAGFSGHGFKLAPAVGNILADLALGSKPSHDVSHFKMDRFDLAQKSKL